ncbi:MAG: Crp/Fnr family transcriptional regulator, partial [Nitrospinota bacterium]
LIESNPEIALNTMISLSRRLRKIDEKVASLAFLDSYGKVARFLLDFMEDNGNDIDGKVIIETNLTRLQMANMAGISRETLTRIFGEFQKRGVIKVQGRNVTILDESLLKREIM